MEPLFHEQVLRGTVERVTYYNGETGYSVLRLQPERAVPPGFAGHDGLVTVVGNMHEVQPGAFLELRGDWATHPRHGKQFKVTHARESAPATLAGLERYLGSGMIRGIGPEMAARIVARFGLETVDVLDADPSRLREVEGIGPKRAEWIAEAWEAQRQIRDVMLFLQGHGVNTGLAVKIFKAYGADAIATVNNDPYRLARDIWGIGFLTADRIAKALGLADDAPSRIEAGVVYALNQASNDGHTYVPRAALVEQAAKLLDVPAALVEEGIVRAAAAEMVFTDRLNVEGAPVDAVYLPAHYFSERGLAARLQAMAQNPASRLERLRHADFDALIARLTAESDIALSPQQAGAVRAALTHKLSVLTGGPGTGKTTTLRAIIRVLELHRYRFALASPTGRAAKRLGEATGHDAKTIHRLLGFAPGEGFEYDEDQPLPADLVVIDEASMLDLMLAYNLLRAVAPDAHLLLVGDVDQLPSVGAGDVLRDIIESGIAHVTRLGTIFRQEAGSYIIHNAHRINAGEAPEFGKDAKDFFLFAFTDPEPEAIADWVVDIVANRIPDRFGIPPTDVQVLVPMYRGPAGVTALNERLQATLNPPGRVAEKRLSGRTFRVGDRVMQTRNNYDKGVFNGDIGRLHAIDPVNQILRLAFDDDRFVDYDFSEADELVHAFAITVHKSQGSEYPAVVMPLLTQHYMMLQRNLLYTAVTRAQRLVVLVGTRRAIHIAVNNDKVSARYSGLAARL
ncbi:MAG: ATP-dependent RecD-like DNA helicase [Anaerolineae bacterium]